MLIAPYEMQTAYSWIWTLDAVSTSDNITNTPQAPHIYIYIYIVGRKYYLAIHYSMLKIYQLDSEHQELLSIGYTYLGPNQHCYLEGCNVFVISCIYVLECAYKHAYTGGASSVAVMVVRNGISNLSSNPRRGCLPFASHSYPCERHESICSCHIPIMDE